MLTNCLAECAHITITVSQIERDIGRKSSFFHTPLHSTPPLRGFPSEHRHPVWYEKTTMAWLPDGEKNSKISLFVLAQLTNVTDGRTDAGWQHIPRLCIALRGKNCDPFRKKLCLIIQLRFIARQHTDARYWYSNSDSLSVCPSVRLSVAFRYCMETA